MVYVDRWRESFGSTAAPLVAWYVPRVWASVDTPKPLCNAIRAIREVAQKELPVGYGIEFSGITREESQTGSNIIVIFLICVFFVYLIMVALYESLFVPLAVILGVPFGLMGALLFAQLFGVENNIYLQVGLIMLIGLLCKTAILLTEYATQCRHAGMSLKQSAFFAAKMRLRPILMTSLTMIFGMLPLMFDAQQMANILQKEGKVSNTTAVQAVSKLAKSANGARVGFELTK